MSLKEVGLFRELLRRQQMTPDFDDLITSKEHLVFIYDEYKSGLSLHSNLAGAKYLGKARTVDTNYQLMVTPSGTVPILLQQERIGSENKPNYHSVKGEVYAVSFQLLLKLDAIHENTRTFEREQKYCVLEDQESPFKVDPSTGRKPPLARSCHIYLGISQVWEHCMLHYATKLHEGERKFWSWTGSQPKNMRQMN